MVVLLDWVHPVTRHGTVPTKLGHEYIAAVLWPGVVVAQRPQQHMVFALVSVEEGLSLEVFHQRISQSGGATLDLVAVGAEVA